MIKSKEEKIRQFSDNALNVTAQLAKMKFPQFEDRIESFKNNIRSLTDHTIRSGLVGITSSGKSAVLNVLLGTGQKILKEQSKATTNMIVFCQKASEPALEINFENKSPVFKKGDKALSHSIWKYTSEDENPGNKHKVKYIRLYIPSFVLDEGLEIADTPGLDAYGHREHEDLTLREFLPQADLVIYLTSIRSPMKEADRRIINKIMDAEQQIVFVQTCKGAVVEQDYGDGDTTSLETMLDKYKKDFENALSPYDKLKGAPIVQVETKSALEYFKSKDENEWEESGFAELEQTINDITGQLKDKYTLRDLNKRKEEIQTLNRLIKNSINKESERENDITELTDFIKKQKYYAEKINADKDEIIAEWTEALNFKSAVKKLKKDLEKTETDDEFYVIADTVQDQVKKIKGEFLDALDDSKKNYKHYFGKLGLDVRRIDLQEMSKSAFFFPNVQKTVRQEEHTQKKELIIDKDEYYSDLEKTLEQYFDPLLKHMEWWENSISFSYLTPLNNKIEAFEKDLENILKHVQFSKKEHEKLEKITAEFDTITEDISPLCDEDPFLEQIIIKEYKKKPLFTHRRKVGHQNLFAQLSTLLMENLLHTNYLKVLAGISNEPEKRVALLGHDLPQQIHFLRRLMRFDDESLIHIQDQSPPFSLNLADPMPGIDNVNIQGELFDELGFVILENDERSLAWAQSADLFNKVDVIQVIVDDLHRVSSAVSDIKERNLFYELFLKHQDKLLLTYPKGAYFNKDRLHLLVEEIPEEIGRIFSKQKLHWFIYENFEVRYNYFQEIGQKLKKAELKNGECLTSWKSLKIPLDEPFSEKILEEQFEELIS